MSGFHAFFFHAETENDVDEAVSLTLEEAIDKLESSGMEVSINLLVSEELLS